MKYISIDCKYSTSSKVGNQEKTVFRKERKNSLIICWNESLRPPSFVGKKSSGLVITT